MATATAVQLYSLEARKEVHTLNLYCLVHIDHRGAPLTEGCDDSKSRDCVLSSTKISHVMRWRIGERVKRHQRCGATRKRPGRQSQTLILKKIARLEATRVVEHQYKHMQCDSRDLLLNIRVTSIYRGTRSENIEASVCERLVRISL
jgi:hypothetical protein